MESTENEGGNALLKTQLTRRTAVTAAAWSAPVVAMASATPAVAASRPFELADLTVAPLGGAEGIYSHGLNYDATGGDSTNDFRRAFVIRNDGEGAFSGNFTVRFSFPRVWNQAVVGGGSDASAFNNWGTRDVFGFDGAIVPTQSPSWSEPANHPGGFIPNVQGSGTEAAWTAVYYQMADTSFTLTNITLPPGGAVTFALNAHMPNSWIHGQNGDNSYLPGAIYWRSNVLIDATSTVHGYLGQYDTGVGSWDNGIWYFNGGGPYAYLPSIRRDPFVPNEWSDYGLYPFYGNS